MPEGKKMGIWSFSNCCHVSVVQRNCLACRKRASSENDPATPFGSLSNTTGAPRMVAQELTDPRQADHTRKGF